MEEGTVVPVPWSGRPAQASGLMGKLAGSRRAREQGAHGRVLLTSDPSSVRVKVL